MKKIAVIAAHPDDEALGCGGTILKHKKQGHKVSLLFMTTGVSARSQVTEQDVRDRQEGFQKAIDILKPEYWQNLSLPDNKLDSISMLDIIQGIEAFLIHEKPDIIYTHFANDLNIDHSLTCKAVMTATRPGSATFVKEVYSFEVPSNTEWAIGNERFCPDTFINISDYINEKSLYLNCYIQEMRLFPHPRSIENILALNQIRGAQVNLKYAEAFMTLRRIINE